MTNNENKTAEEIYLEHVGKAVNARSVYYARAIQAMHHFALQQSQSALGEITKDRDDWKDKWFRLDKITASFYHKVKLIAKQNKELKKENEKLLCSVTTEDIGHWIKLCAEKQSQLSLKDKEIEELKEVIYTQSKDNVNMQSRIKELEEAWIKTLLAGVYVSDREYALKYINSLLSPSKEQKEGENYCNCNTPKDFDKDWIGKLCPDCSKEIVGPF